jgi:hypothetical protein
VAVKAFAHSIYPLLAISTEIIIVAIVRIEVAPTNSYIITVWFFPI